MLTHALIREFGADGLVACDLVSEAGGVYLPVMGECSVSNESNQTLQIEMSNRRFGVK